MCNCSSNQLMPGALLCRLLIVLDLTGLCLVCSFQCILLLPPLPHPLLMLLLLLQSGIHCLHLFKFVTALNILCFLTGLSLLDGNSLDVENTLVVQTRFFRVRPCEPFATVALLQPCSLVRLLFIPGEQVLGFIQLFFQLPHASILLSDLLHNIVHSLLQLGLFLLLLSKLFEGLAQLVLHRTNVN